MLDAAQRRDDRRVTELLRISWLGSWAADQLTRPNAAKEAVSPLGALAAVAALHTGIDARLSADVVAGELHLPGMGTLAIAEHPNAQVVLDVHDGRIDVLVAGGRLRLPTTRTHDWSPVRVLAGDGLHVLFDDRHPGRDCFNEPPERPLPEETFRRWRRVVLGAWRLLTRIAPAVAGQMSQGFRVLVPLAPSPHGEETTISCADALGAIATTAPSDPAEFAIALVHEWSHTLLNGLLGFVTLHAAAADPPLYFVPWRPDARPVSGVLHGTFAFLAVAETWRALLDHGDLARQAAIEFALRRMQLAEVLATLPAVPELTAQGRRFVEILRQRHGALMDITLHPETIAQATVRIAHQRAAWARHERS